MSGRKLTEAEHAAWRESVIATCRARAKTGADIVLHGVAQGLIDEGIFDTEEAHDFVARAMIEELEDHDLPAA